MYNTNTDIWLVRCYPVNPRTNSNRKSWRYSKAGALAAFTVDFVVYPLDTLKTRIQSPRYRELYIDAATGAVKRGVLFRGLYQGIWSVVIATIPSCMFHSTKSCLPFQFMSWELTLRISQRGHSSLHTKVWNIFSITPMIRIITTCFHSNTLSQHQS